MGGEKQTTVQNVTQEQKVTPTPGQIEQDELLLESFRQTQPRQTELQLQGMDLTSQLLEGGELPGYLGGVQGGIQGMGQLGQLPTLDRMSGQIGEEQIGRLVSQGLEDIMPQFQSSGILDSGVAAELSGELATGIRTDVAESNLERSLAIDEFNLERQRAAQEYDIGMDYSRQAFNQGQLLNLLNLGVGGQAQVQSPILAQSGMLANNLAGLRSTSMSGTTNTQQTMMNPFLKSFQQSLGQNLGSTGSEALKGFSF